MNIRPARVGDVPAICDLIRTFADRKLMIRRSLGELYESIREFFVATDDAGKVIGCAALHVFWDDLAELKCLAVSEEVQGRGTGRKLVEACWDAARELEIQSVFTLTYVADFFERCGYHRIEKSDLPHKIWNECVRCPLFPSCNEVALIRSAEGATGVGVESGVAVLAHSFQIPDSRFQIPDSRFQIPDSRFQIPDSRFQIRMADRISQSFSHLESWNWESPIIDEPRGRVRRPGPWPIRNRWAFEDGPRPSWSRPARSSS